MIIQSVRVRVSLLSCVVHPVESDPAAPLVAVGGGVAQHILLVWLQGLGERGPLPDGTYFLFSTTNRSRDVDQEEWLAVQT